MGVVVVLFGVFDVDVIGGWVVVVGGEMVFGSVYGDLV